MKLINYSARYEACDRRVKQAIKYANSAIKGAYPEGVYMCCNHGTKNGKWHRVLILSAGYDHAYHGFVIVENVLTGKVKRVSPSSLKM